LIRTIRFIWFNLERKEQHRFALIVTTDLLINLADIASLALLLLVVRYYMEADAVFSSHLFSSNAGSSIIPAVVLLFMFLGKNGLALLQAAAWARFLSGLASRLSSQRFENFQQQSYQQYLSEHSSAQVRRIAFEPFEFCQYGVVALQQFLTQGGLIFFTGIAIIIVNPAVSLLLVVALAPVCALVFYHIRRTSVDIQLQLSKTNETSFRALSEGLAGFIEGKMFGSRHFFRERFLASRSEFVRAFFRSVNLQQWPSRIIELVAVCGFILLVLLLQGGFFNRSGLFLVLGSFVLAAYKLIPGIVKMINTAGQMKAHHNAVSAFHQPQSDPLLSRCEKIESIEIRNLCFGYDEVGLINNFQLDLHPGQVVGIRGSSGKGKSSMLHLLLGLLEPCGGTILVNGKNRSAGELRDLWSRISLMRQQSFLIADTVEKNITLENKTAMKLDALLRDAGVRDWASADTLIEEGGKNISGGQGQRIHFARSMAKDADLYLLDEPFNELDAGTTEQLFAIVKKRAREGGMFLIVTHDPLTLTRCDKIASLHD